MGIFGVQIADDTIGLNNLQPAVRDLITDTSTTPESCFLVRDGEAAGGPGHYAVERGSAGDDAVFHWSEANDRWEVGKFDTVGGTVTPASLSVISRGTLSSPCSSKRPVSTSPTLRGSP